MPKPRPTETPKTDTFSMRTDGEFLARIDDWRRKQRVIPTRAEAIRQLIELGIRADQGGQK